MRFVAESIIRAAPERVFAFHELPDAFERLTPAWAGTRAVEPARTLAVGSRTIVKLRVVPFVWIHSEFVHTACERPALFVDEQARGPFRNWRHQHLMTRVGDGTRLSDVIDFEPPLGIAGRWLAPVAILIRLRKLFTYRHEVTRVWCERGR